MYWKIIKKILLFKFNSGNIISEERGYCGGGGRVETYLSFNGSGRKFIIIVCLNCFLK